MKYIAAFERRAEARGEKRGIELGQRRGIELGERRGIELGEKRGIELGQGRILSKLLKLKFGTLPEWVSKKMEGAKADQLEIWSERILTAQKPEEIFEV